MSDKKISVLLLKASEEEPLVKDLSTRYDIRSIPVLDFEFCNLDLLLVALKSPEKYSSLIITSPRGATSIEKVLSNSNSSSDLIKSWFNKFVYVVGSSTATEIEKLGLRTKGSKCGNSELLSDVIIKDYEGIEHKPPLYISGNLKLDILPSKLHNKGIYVENIVTYQTVFHTKFEFNLKEYISMKGSPNYIVFYSPSGINYAENYIKEFCPHSKLIAAGPTTAKAMMSKYLEVYSVPEQPTLQSILTTII